MPRPCTTCPSLAVQSCCGNRNLKVASVFIGVFKTLLFMAGIVAVVSVMSGSAGQTDSEKQLASHSTGQLLIMLALLVGQLFLTVILLAGIFKKRRNYVMIYWAANCVLIILTVVSLFSQPPGVAQFLLTFCYIILDIYFQLVIRSYYLKMTSDSSAAAAARTEVVPPNPAVSVRY